MNEYTFRYCYIFDYSNDTINRLDLSNESKLEYHNDEDLLIHWGFNPDTCAWMFSDNELDVNIIHKPLI